MTDEEKTVWGCVGFLAYVVVALPLTTAFYGFVGAKLWLWFVTPTFHLSPLTIWQAIGLMFLVRFAIFDSSINRDQKKGESATMRMLGSTILSVLVGLAALGCGWIVSHYV